jgi:hypothetical protein
MGGGSWSFLVVDGSFVNYQLHSESQCLQGVWATLSLHAMQVCGQWWTGFLCLEYQFYQFSTTSGPFASCCEKAPREADC